jgi:lysozyme
MTRAIGVRGLELIKSFETLELEAYPDPGSPLGKQCTSMKLPMRDYRKVPAWAAYSGDPWTYGWGHTGAEVRPGERIDQARADVLLLQDTEHAADAVSRLVTVTLNHKQFDALVSFVYNVGVSHFANSTLLRNLNLFKLDMAAGQFLVWNKASGVVMLGLVRRRKAERDLFVEPVI